jgi:hypothetical protein
MNKAEAGELVMGESTHSRRVRLFSALLTKESGLGTNGIVVVGGSAIEIYTEGDYVSEDLDLIVSSRGRILEVLKNWGFENEGKIWSNASWKIFVDAMEGDLSGSRRLTRVISTSVGPLCISGVEDLIIRRIRESVAWQGREEAFAQAVLLLRHNSSDLDWDYIRFFARREGWERQLGELRSMAGLTK